MKIKKSRFKFCKDEEKSKSKITEKENDNGDFDELSKDRSLREIAYQLKRIADLFRTIVEEA